MKKESKKERDYQPELIERIKVRYLPGSTVLKNDPDYIQGIPDLAVLYGNKYALLEVKRSKEDSHQPNQDYYVDKFNKEAFSAFIYPENEEQVINDMVRYFKDEKTKVITVTANVTIDTDGKVTVK